MPTATNLKRQITRRIANSGLSLTVNYPAVRAAATGTAPGAAPAGPLTGPIVTNVVVVTDPTPSQAPVTLDCLWLSSYTSVTSSVAKDAIDYLKPAWVEGATALATVTIEDAALDATQPYGDTVFTGCSYVEHLGLRYTVLSVQPMGPSFAPPYVYYVWVTGAAKQE